MYIEGRNCMLIDDDEDDEIKLLTAVFLLVLSLFFVQDFAIGIQRKPLGITVEGALNVI